MGRLCLLRHGRPDEQGLPRFLGQTDLPLAETGRRQSVWWRERLGRIEFSRIVTSDLSRARETAGIIAGADRQRIEPLAALREVYLGEWENRLFSEVRESTPALWNARGRDLGGFRPPGGESFDDLQRRVIPVVRNLLATGGGNILVVAHAGVNRVILCDILGMPLNRMFSLAQDHGCLNLIETHPSGMRVRALNLTPELMTDVGTGSGGDKPPAGLWA
jgi:alpha-ribazole phosphatase